MDSVHMEQPGEPSFPVIDLDGDLSDGALIPVGAKMAVVGVGGAGCNAVNRMIAERLPGVQFLAVNTDRQALAASKAPVRIQIGEKVTKGLGAGGRPEVGRQAIEESIEEVLRRVEGYDLVFVTAGMGGGTGTGAAPVIAKRIREQGILTIAIVSTPFPFEGRKRMRFAEEGVSEMTAVADTVLVVPNARLLEMIDQQEDMTFAGALKRADEVLLNATRGISGVIAGYGEINTDFADVKTIMADGGAAILGCGSAIGNDRAKRAAEMAVHSPLLDNIQLSGAKRLLVNVRGTRNIRISEVDEAVTLVRQSAHPDAELIFGMEFVEAVEGMEESMDVTVVATGFESDEMLLPLEEPRLLRPVESRPVKPREATPPPSSRVEESTGGATEESQEGGASGSWLSRLVRRKRESTEDDAQEPEEGSPSPVRRPSGMPPSFLRPD